MNIEGDDGYRVYINGDRIMNRWGKHTIQRANTSSRLPLDKRMTSR